MSDSEDRVFLMKPLSEIDIGTKKVQFSSFTWDIGNYEFKTCKVGEEIETPVFWSSNSKWTLSVFPNGERWNGTVGNVLFSLTKVSAVKIKLTAFCEIIIQREGKYDFFNGRHTFNENNESFRFPFLLSRSDVLRKDCGYFDDDFLHITCHLFVFGEESPESSARAITLNPEEKNSPDKIDVGSNTSSEDFDENPPEKKDAETNISSTDFCNLSLDKDQPTEKEGNLISISADFEELFNNQRFADVTLKLDKHEFSAHKVILRSRSKVFEAMFEHDMQENRHDTVDLVDMEVDTFKDMLRYIYCGKVRPLSPEEAIDLYVAADRYDLQELVLYCRKIALNGLSIENICKISAVADLHNDQLLMESVKFFLSKDLKEVLKTDTWMMFAVENPILSSKLIRSAILNEC